MPVDDQLSARDHHDAALALFNTIKAHGMKSERLLQAEAQAQRETDDLEAERLIQLEEQTRLADTLVQPQESSQNPDHDPTEYECDNH